MKITLVTSLAQSGFFQKCYMSNWVKDQNERLEEIN